MHLGCSHLLAFLNNAALNMAVQIFVQAPAVNSSVYVQRNSVCNFSGTAKLSSTAAAPFPSPPAVAGSRPSTPSPALAIFCCFDNSHSNGYKRGIWLWF